MVVNSLTTEVPATVSALDKVRRLMSLSMMVAEPCRGHCSETTVGIGAPQGL